MKVTCQIEKILTAAAMAERVVGKKASLPVLACIVLEAKKDFRIRATNLEVGVETRVPSDVDSEGTVAVPASVLVQTLQATRGNTVSITLDEDNVRIETEMGKSTIKTIPHDEFPLFPKPESQERISFDSPVFIDGIGAVHYCASQSMVRPELASISISYEDTHLVFAATDSFRLAEKRINTKITGEFTPVLLPTKNALELSHILTQSGETEAQCVFDEGQLSVFAGATYFFSRTTDGAFPNYREVIPREIKTEATVLKSDFAHVLKKMRIFSNTSGQVGFHVYPKQKVFSVTAQNADVGETADTLEAALSGEDIDINFNLRYLTEGLQSLTTDSISLQFAGNSKPLIITGVSDPSCTYLVMPLNR